MLTGPGIGHGLDDIAERRIGLEAVHCRVEIQAARQTRPPLVAVGYRHAVHFQEALVDAAADSRDTGHLIARVEQVFVDRWDRAEAARVWIQRAEDVRF